MRMEWREKGLQQNREQWQEKQQRHDQHVGREGPTGNNTRYTTRRSSRSHARPPLPPNNGSCEQSVPLWEKKFCTSVCRVPWAKLCETKKHMLELYPKIVQWNDSEGEEAFNNAKARYWAEINGLSCDIPMPDPDMYIDIVDQNTIIDPKLVEDVYKPPPVLYDSNIDERWDSFLFKDIPVIPTGWGDDSEESDAKKFYSGLIVPTGWDDETPNESNNAICDVANATTFAQNNQNINSATSIVNTVSANTPNDQQVQWEHQFCGNNVTTSDGYGRKIDGQYGFQGDYSGYYGYRNPTKNFRKGRGRRLQY